jgi:hypothetical protein
MSSDQSGERRRLAAACLALARQSSDLKTRVFLLDMAQKWLDLAELSEHDGWNEALRVRALQAGIGEELRTHYKLQQELPHWIFTFLMQLKAQTDAD